MSENILQSKEFVKACKDATKKALAGKVKDEDVKEFLNHMPSETEKALRAVGLPAPAEAIGETYTVLIYGYVKCTPTHLDHYFEANHWGLGLAGVKGYGFLYTAYDSWDSLFRETTGYHAQGIAEAGGILQINWFNGSGVPVGQFNAAAVGIGAFEVGGKGHWEKK